MTDVSEHDSKEERESHSSEQSRISLPVLSNSVGFDDFLGRSGVRVFQEECGLLLKPFLLQRNQMARGLPRLFFEFGEFPLKDFDLRGFQIDFGLEEVVVKLHFV